jgi:hypothetical protein
VTPYVQREIFRAFEQVVFARATRFVGCVGSHWGNELRCHELARAVHAVLDIGSTRVVDGGLGIIEHSWIEIVVPVADFERERVGRGHKRTVILDVYCPGRLPQVQLVDSFVLLKPTYEEREPRTDVRTEIIARLVSEMRSAS